MRKIALALAILGTTLVPALYTAPAHAQATRTWVSGVGSDANPCSRTAPCKTFAGAISKTVTGGEIDVLDPGGFGALTITKSITIDGGGGQVASVLVSGTNGINIAAGSTDVVILKNLRFQGLLNDPTGSAGVNGINVTSAAQVVIENCEIYGFNTNGINVALSATGIVKVLHSQLFNNKTQITAGTTSGAAIVQVVDSSFAGTNNAGTPSQGGLLANSKGNITVTGSDFQDLTFGVQAASGGAVSADNSSFFTAVGIINNSSTPANASNDSFYAGTACNGNTLNSAKNNRIGTGVAAGSCTVSAMTGE